MYFLFTARDLGITRITYSQLVHGPYQLEACRSHSWGLLEGLPKVVHEPSSYTTGSSRVEIAK